MEISLCVYSEWSDRNTADFCLNNTMNTASFTHVLYLSSTGPKNCDSADSPIMDTLTLRLHPVLKPAYFTMCLGICRISFTCSQCESFEMERDFRRWMLVSGKGCKIERHSFVVFFPS